VSEWKPPFADDPGKLVDLYKYYEGVGSQARIQMVTTANWMLGFAIALLVYTTENTIWLSGSGALCRGASTISLLAPLAGLILCALVGATVHEFTQHVSRNWMRATRCKELVPDLHWLVEEEGGAPPPDLTGGWPGYLKSYAGFAAYKPPAGPRRRLQGLLLLYTWLPWILGALFAVILLLAIGLDACPAAHPAG
jgi:hypothetical protein